MNQVVKNIRSGICSELKIKEEKYKERKNAANQSLEGSLKQIKSVVKKML